MIKMLYAKVQEIITRKRHKTKQNSAKKTNKNNLNIFLSIL